MPSDQTVNKTIHVDALLSKVWHTLTHFGLIEQWISQEAQTTVISDWQVGRPIVFSGSLHGYTYRDNGIVLQFEPEKRLEYSYWSQISRLPDLPENYSIIDFRLVAEANDTVLTLTQSNFADEIIYKHWNFYWNATLNRIKKIAEQL